MGDIIINPEYAKLIEEIKQLKEDVANLYEEKDELIYHICRNIEAEYMSKVGILEYKLYEFQCKILRIKRKIELYQAKINRQEEPNEEEIERRLEIEYKEYEEKLEAMSDNIQILIERENSAILSEEKKNELKSIYRRMIKKLHPDLNRDNSERNKKLLLQITQAYENGDLETLKNLELLCSEIVERDEIEQSGMEDLIKQKEKYSIIIKNLLERIKKIKESFPYNQQEFLKNEILVQEKKDDLNSRIEMCKSLYSNLEELLKKIKGE